MARNSQPAGTETDRGGRLSLPLTPDGTAIDWERVRGSNKDKFLSVLETDPQIKAAYREMNGLGETDQDSADLFAGVTEANINEALNILSQVEALVFRSAARRWFKHPLFAAPDGKWLPMVIEPDIALACFKLTDAQHQELDPRLTRIAKKHQDKMPKWMRENLDWLAVGLMYLRYTATNAQNAIIAQVKRDLGKIQKAQAEAAATVRKPDSDAQPRPVVSNVQPVQPINGHDRAATPVDFSQPLAGDHFDVAEPEPPTV